MTTPHHRPGPAPDANALHTDAAAATASRPTPRNKPPSDRAGDERTAAQVRELVDRGSATPLLPGVFPVPVRIDGLWWAIHDQPPASRPGSVEDDLAVYRPVSPSVATRLDRDAARLAAARDAAQGAPLVAN
jgi:hypothetical protein